MVYRVYTRAMIEIGIRELRSDLSNHVKKAARGETVVITVGGKRTAKLVPLPTGPVRQTMEEAYESGRIIRAPRRGETPPPPPPRIETDRPSKEILDEIREDRF